jgi:1-acyl-sn-glycerol-3-phosphate acyltransferase
VTVPKAHPDSRAYRLVALIVRPLMFAITRRDWQGAENIPATGGFIAAGNHMSNIDPLTFAHFLYHHGRAHKILAKASLWKIPGLRLLLDRTGMIPVQRNTAGAASSVSAAVDQLALGECVAVFPEGTLTRDPDLWPMVGKTGAARLALASRMPVVPIAQWGMQDIRPRYSKRFRPIPPKNVAVHAGPPVDLSDLYERPIDSVTLREATNRIMDAITGLLEEIRGEKAPAERFDVRKNPGSEERK